MDAVSQVVIQETSEKDLVFEKVVQLFVKVYPDAGQFLNISGSRDLNFVNSSGIRSVQIVRFISEIENVFSINIGDEPADLDHFTSLDEVTELIINKKNRSHTPKKCDFSYIRYVHTLGPKGTNCEMASNHWLKSQNIEAKIILHNSLEEAIVEVNKDKEASVLLSCIVYPHLHNLVFEYLSSLQILDCFVKNTYRMVLAAKERKTHYGTIITHPAPQSLVNVNKIVFASSNSAAAISCAKGEYEACITTAIAAKDNNLLIVKDFGEVSMGFAIHGKKWN